MEKQSLDESLNGGDNKKVMFHDNEELHEFLHGNCGTCIRGDNCKQRVDLSKGYHDSQTKFDSAIVRRGENWKVDCRNYQEIYGLM